MAVKVRTAYRLAPGVWAVRGVPLPKSNKSFINKIARAAALSQARFGVPASITIAQAILESGWGKSTLASKYNNYFGIKGRGPAGTVRLSTSEYYGGWTRIRDGFRVYKNVQGSIDDHAKLLAFTPKYYARAMRQKNRPDDFARALQGVYATDPGYAGKLISLMRTYNLYRYNQYARTLSAALKARNKAAKAGKA